MELRQLNCFLACARNHSLTLAAEELYTTQPHVSMVIKSLEQELGTALFIRKSKGVELTEAGRQINLDWQRRCRVMEEAMLSGFNPEERRQFADYLSRAYRNLRAEREEGTE